MPDDGETGPGGLFDELRPVRLPGGVDLGETVEVPEGLLVGVDLVVYPRPVALAGAHEQLFGAMILQQEVVYGRVAADVRVLEGVAGETAREQSCDGALYAVVLVPGDLMVQDVHTTCGVPLRRRSG